MSDTRLATRRSALLDDPLAGDPDTAERVVLMAVRAWLHPDCDAARTRFTWRDVLAEAGIHADGADHFDMMMCTLACSSARPLDMRCRCAKDLAYDEASLLQTIAHLQSTRGEAAMRVLNDWLPAFSVSGVLKLTRWFSISLLDAGLEIRARARRDVYPLRFGAPGRATGSPGPPHGTQKRHRARGRNAAPTIRFAERSGSGATRRPQVKPAGAAIVRESLRDDVQRLSNRPNRSNRQVRPDRPDRPDRRPSLSGRPIGQASVSSAPQHFLYFLPLPHEHASLRPTFGASRRIVWVSRRCFASSRCGCQNA
ncbi:MAG: hypothetical protein GAK40_01300 [Burkholderia plantarii]|nr:MAG: hypothetical protein GAK40_01300 [Burkholderia plantarii]